MDGKSFMKRDSHIFGVILALIIPVAAALIFSGINYLTGSQLHVLKYLPDSGIILLSLAMNLIAMRYYLVKYKLEKTGRAILAVTFVLFLLYFLFLHEKGINIIPFN
ncbi:MAG TPA: hypothetical protein PLP88_09220 [Bacteroidales bacterium]|nr:hypothetical protein [Bacteroidales bacterium]